MNNPNSRIIERPIKFQYKEVDIIAISDTHARHRDIIVEPCDILIHCGDACNAGDEEELKDFFLWFSEQPAKHKIFVFGNHDLPFELYPEMAEELMPDDVLLLNNRIIELESITIVGIEATMGLLNVIEIDEPIDIMVSHCAPKNIADGGAGCEKLRELIFKTKPSISIFGHFHEYGDNDTTINDVRFLNVACREI